MLVWRTIYCRKSGGKCQDDILKDSIKGISTVLKLSINACVSHVLAIVTEMNAKTCGLAGS